MRSPDKERIGAGTKDFSASDESEQVHCTS